MIIQNKKNYFAFLIIAFSGALAFFSMLGDSAIVDEIPHIGAGYSYLDQKDMRLNPEHPPLIKNLAAIPLQFMDLNAPYEDKSWQKDINGQWDFGRKLIYESENNADKIVILARLPIIILMMLLGWLIFSWTKKLYGDKAAFLALIIYSFSPTVLAHGRLVTTDIGASLGFFIGIYSFINYLEKPSAKNLIIASLAFGAAQLLKFSTFLLIPLFGVMILIKTLTDNITTSHVVILKILLKYIGKTALVVALGYIFIVYPVYAYNTLNYPIERNLTDAKLTMSSFGIRPLVNFDLWLISKPILRPLGEYLFGWMMVVQRATGGNTTYFLGEVSAAGWKYYFPIVYFIKEHLSLHILTLIALFLTVKNSKIYETIKSKNLINELKKYAENNFSQLAMLIFIFIYWFTSIKSNLNIGVRHILPTFPFIYILISGKISQWLSQKPSFENISLTNAAGFFIKHYWQKIKKYAFVSALLIWYVLNTILVFPHFLASFNELVGGPANGYKYVVDSNADWGQDLKRLNKWVQKENIDKIYLDYFGWASPAYYLKEKFIPWNSTNGEPPINSYFAVSATFLQQALGKPAEGFTVKSEDNYSWLKNKKPIKRIGYSIFVYKF